MVNINVFGRVNEVKKVPIIGDEKKVATVFLTNKDDVESSVLVEDGNSGRRKSACLTCITELCALLVVALIILCTALLLVRLWGVKREVDQMEPLVQRVMNDLQTLKQQAEAIQAAEEFNAPRFPESFPMEDTSREALIILARGDDDASDDSDDAFGKINSPFQNQLLQLMLNSIKDQADVILNGSIDENLNADASDLIPVENTENKNGNMIIGMDVIIDETASDDLEEDDDEDDDQDAVKNKITDSDNSDDDSGSDSDNAHDDASFSQAAKA